MVGVYLDAVITIISDTPFLATAALGRKMLRDGGIMATATVRQLLLWAAANLAIIAELYLNPQC